MPINFRRKNPAIKADVDRPQSDPALTAAYQRSVENLTGTMGEIARSQREMQARGTELQAHVDMERTGQINESIRQMTSSIGDAIKTKAYLNMYKGQQEANDQLQRDIAWMDSTLQSLDRQDNYGTDFGAAEFEIMRSVAQGKLMNAMFTWSLLQEDMLNKNQTATDDLHERALKVVQEGKDALDARKAELALGAGPPQQPAAGPAGGPAAKPPTTQPAARQKVTGQTTMVTGQPARPPAATDRIQQQQDSLQALQRKRRQQTSTSGDRASKWSKIVEEQLERAKQREPVPMQAAVPAQAIAGQADFSKGLDGIWQAMTEIYGKLKGSAAVAGQNVQQLMQQTVAAYSGDKLPAQSPVPTAVAGGAIGVIDNLILSVEDWTEKHQAKMTPEERQGADEALRALTRTRRNLVKGPGRQIIADEALKKFVNESDVLTYYYEGNMDMVSQVLRSQWQDYQTSVKQMEEFAPKILAQRRMTARKIRQIRGELDEAIASFDKETVAKKLKEYRQAQATAELQEEEILGAMGGK